MSRLDEPLQGRSLDDYMPLDDTETMLLELSASADMEPPAAVRQYQARRQVGQLTLEPTVQLELAAVQQKRFQALLTRLFS